MCVCVCFSLTLKVLVIQTHVAVGAPVSLVDLRILYACVWLVITTITKAKFVRVVSICLCTTLRLLLLE